MTAGRTPNGSGRPRPVGGGSLRAAAPPRALGAPTAGPAPVAEPFLGSGPTPPPALHRRAPAPTALPRTLHPIPKTAAPQLVPRAPAEVQSALRRIPEVVA